MAKDDDFKKFKGKKPKNVKVPSGTKGPDVTQTMRSRAAGESNQPTTTKRSNKASNKPGFGNAPSPKPKQQSLNQQSLSSSVPKGTPGPNQNESMLDRLARGDNKKSTERGISSPFNSKSATLDDIKIRRTAKNSKSIEVEVPKGSPGPNKPGQSEGPQIGRFKADKDTNKPKVNTKINKDFALSLRYRVPEKLKRTPKKKLKELAQYVMDQIERHDTGRSEFIERIRKYREAWRNFDKAGLDIHIDGQHDEHIPLIFERGKIMHSRIFQAVYKIEPPFNLKPRKAVSEKQKEEKQQLLSYVVLEHMNERRGILEEGDKDVWNFVFDGTSITKHFWKRDVRKFVEVNETLKKPITIDENGNPETEETEEEVERVVYDGAMMETRPLESVRIIGPRAETIDEADMVADELEFTKSELIKQSRIGFFMSNAVDMVLAKTEPQNQAARHGSGLDQKLRSQAERLAGLQQDHEGRDTYRVFEAYLDFDIDGDGIDESLVVWVEEQSRTIMRMTYLDRVSPNGKRPFELKKFIPVEGSPYGIGMGELLFGINNLLDYVANQRLDAGTFQTFPWFFYTAGSGMDAGDLVIGPGKGIPVDDPSQIQFPRVNGNTNYTFNEEALITKYADRVSSISEFMQGMTGGQGIARTATGAAGLIQEVNTNLDIFIQRYQAGFKRNLQYIDKQVQELLPLGLEFTIRGPNSNIVNKRFKDRQAIKWDTDFELSGNSINSNKAIERDTAAQLLQTILNPVVLQSGLVGPSQLYNGLKNLLQKLEIKDINSYLIQPEETKLSQFSAKDELNMIIAGVKPPVQINDKHAEKVAFFEQFEQSDEFGFLDAAHLPLYAEVKQAHQQFAQSIAAQAPIAANSGGAVDPNLASQVLAAAGSGNPQGGVPNQITDLLAESSTLNNE